MFHAVTTKGPQPRPHLMAALGEQGRAAISAYLADARSLSADAADLAAGACRGERCCVDPRQGRGAAARAAQFQGARRRLCRRLAGARRSRAQARPHGWPQPISPRQRCVPSLPTMTVACATDGNHGRSVAWGARTAGCRAVIFIHAGVSQSRADAMAAFGADMRRIAGSYDDSVRIAAETAAREGWTVVSDTSWEGYEAIPLTVMQGYTATIGEALDALSEPPTHIFLQGGRRRPRRSRRRLCQPAARAERAEDRGRRAGARRLPVRQRQGRQTRDHPAWRSRPSWPCSNAQRHHRSLSRSCSHWPTASLHCGRTKQPTS